MVLDRCGSGHRLPDEATRSNLTLAGPISWLSLADEARGE